MSFVQENKTILLIGAVGFVIWLLFHFAAKKAAAAATAAAANPGVPGTFQATLTYP